MNIHLLLTGIAVLAALVVFLLTTKKSDFPSPKHQTRPLPLPSLSFGREQLLKVGFWIVFGLVVAGTGLLIRHLMRSPSGPEELAEGAASEDMITYNLLRADSSARQLHFKISVPENTSKESLISIASNLRDDYHWHKPLMCVFFPETDTTAAMASIAYRPDCPRCATDEDADGTGVVFKRF